MDDRTNYEWCKAHGICPRCQKRKARPGRVTCAECSARNVEAARRSYERLTPEERRARMEKQPAEVRARYCEQSKACQRKRKEARKAAGLCVVCGKVPPRPERLTCAACAAKNAAYAREARLKRKEKAYGKV